MQGRSLVATSEISAAFRTQIFSSEQHGDGQFAPSSVPASYSSLKYSGDYCAALQGQCDGRALSNVRKARSLSFVQVSFKAHPTGYGPFVSLHLKCDIDVQCFQGPYLT